MNLLSMHKGLHRTYNIFGKNEITFRSRLQIWIQKKQLQTLRLMTVNKPVNKIKQIEGDAPEENMEDTTNFFYGYEYNKNNESWANSDIKLVVKMLEEELKYKNVIF